MAADKKHWDLGGRDLAILLEEAKSVKGESLWQDAWRRLRANGAAFLALRFLALVAAVAFLAPLFPVPSPIALDLQDEPQPPVAPWSELGNHGWQHRVSITFDVAGEGLAEGSTARRDIEAALGEAVAQAADATARPSWQVKPETDALSLELALPFAERHTQAQLQERIGGLVGSVAPNGSLALEGGGLASVTLANVEPKNGYWELNLIDRSLVWLRQRLFGFWQTSSWMGQDSKGRDTLSRIVWGSRISIQVALAAAACSLLIGVTYGAFSGFMGGRIDRLMMRIVDVLYSVPFIFVVIFLLTLLSEYEDRLASFGIERMTVFYVVVGAIYWLTMARVVRGQVLSLKNSEFIEAARVIGASTPRILFVHVVPNVLSIVIVYLTLTIPAVMLFEAFLSFLGLGVEAPRVSWGLLAVDSTEAISAIKVWWWLVVWPAAAMGSTLLALSILGDGVRDALDPKLRGRD